MFDAMSAGTSAGFSSESTYAADMESRYADIAREIRRGELLSRQKAMEAELKRMASLPVGWDSYDAEPPSADAIRLATRVLSACIAADLPPSRVRPSVEGGVAVTFLVDGGYADIECFNDGTMVAGRSLPPKPPLAWDVELANLSTAIEKIRHELGR